jgi:predicted nucleic acid-binding protein
MMMAAKAFVDTNVLLRSIIPQMSQHQEAEALIQRFWEDDYELWISRQIIREYLVQATHPKSFTPSLTIEQVTGQIDVIQTLFRIADEIGEMTIQLLDLLKRFPTRGKQIHDANIVAAMFVHGIDTLLTIDIEDFRRFDDRIVLVSP